MSSTRTRRFVLVMAATALAAGGTSLSTTAFAAPEGRDPKIPDKCGVVLTDEGDNVCRGQETDPYPEPEADDIGDDRLPDPGADEGPRDEDSADDSTSPEPGTGQPPAGNPSDAAGGDNSYDPDTDPGDGEPSDAAGGDNTPESGSDQGCGNPPCGDFDDYGVYTPPDDPGPVVN
ncbi:hypothetical protein ACGFZB_38165 [Streptomyces cinerochromogenes]|uniref:Uncharacterized protein n=1 Tax=Streptomyces cinerochromogenes TaxID=66422 RepID=A0ABW7BK99_9ACTN